MENEKRCSTCKNFIASENKCKLVLGCIGENTHRWAWCKDYEKLEGGTQMKNYEVFYWIKANSTETLHSLVVEAANSKEACSKCKAQVFAKTGRNAFRPTTKNPRA